MQAVFIYALKDPTTGLVRYIGKAGDPKKRLCKHFNECRNQHFRRANWLNSLAATGQKPFIEILAEVPKTEWQFWERFWIQTFRECGADLVNGTDGGDGLDNPSPEIRKKISEASKGENNHRFGKPGFFTGHKHRPESLAKMSAAKIGTKQSPETVIKRISKCTGQKRTPEQCAAVSAGKIAANKKKKI